MPRYAYSCSACNIEYLTRHASNDILEVCEKCGISGTLTKLLTKPISGFKKRSVSKIGEVTKDFIEDARKELKEQRKELKEQR
jgi:putative FmdB family regulatory protein|tara:strand:- start:305 stop:553 length:249 start_codon:yes stop_codon:yes gene_type:complete